MRVTPTSLPLLSSGEIQALKARALVSLRNASDTAERDKWAAFLLAADAELGKRAGSGSQRRSRRPSAKEKRDLAERVLDARESLYREQTRGEVKRRASEVRAEMRGRR